jgi:hypothetical protein
LVIAPRSARQDAAGASFFFPAGASEVTRVVELRRNDEFAAGVDVSPSLSHLDHRQGEGSEQDGGIFRRATDRDGRLLDRPPEGDSGDRRNIFAICAPGGEI